MHESGGNCRVIKETSKHCGGGGGFDRATDSEEIGKDMHRLGNLRDHEIVKDLWAIGRRIEFEMGNVEQWDVKE